MGTTTHPTFLSSRVCAVQTASLTGAMMFTMEDGPVFQFSTPASSIRMCRQAVRSDRGFTLIELLVVVVIIGLLAGLVAPRYFGQVGKSNTNIARAQIEQLGKALDTYRLDIGVYPTTEQGLQALVAKPDGVDRWQGPYLQKQVPADPWGRAYRYKSPGDHSDYDLASYGSDGQPGGTGEAQDVNSWETSATVKTQ
jgi:general secretion pathway protein G